MHKKIALSIVYATLQHIITIVRNQKFMTQTWIRTKKLNKKICVSKDLSLTLYFSFLCRSIHTIHIPFLIYGTMRNKKALKENRFSLLTEFGVRRSALPSRLHFTIPRSTFRVCIGCPEDTRVACWRSSAPWCSRCDERERDKDRTRALGNVYPVNYLCRSYEASISLLSSSSRNATCLFIHSYLPHL